MIVKKYVVKNMNEAISKIKQELGPDAVIINQKKIKKSGLKGLFSHKMIEVTAAVDNTKKNLKYKVHTEVKNKVLEEVSKSSIEAIKKAIENKSIISQREVAMDKSKNIKNQKREEILIKNDLVKEELVKEVKEMKDMLTKISISKSIPQVNDFTGSDLKIKKKLQENDVREDIVMDILSKLKDMDSNLEENEKIKKLIENRISISNFNDSKVVVLVGPTGVGKTTTIAKMAGRFALLEKKKVGLITVDTYRIGAVEQLSTYANIMSIPFKAVFSIKEMISAINSMNDCDVILVDTTGRSSKNVMQIAELNIFIQKTNTQDIHLVISATTKNKDIDSIVQGYRMLNYNSVIITKLDETTTYGSILNILDSAKKPLSFVTTGQNVPDDFKKLTPEDVSKLILGENLIC